MSYPVTDGSLDLITSFSVFTHIYEDETFIYLKDAARVLRPGGALVMSILEIERHWDVFAFWAEQRKADLGSVPTVCLEIPTLQLLARKGGLSLDLTHWDTGLGQTVCVLRRP
jgi:ubiquinone/menaquinone biosynthesis C-methylase UbiE